jgi:TPR repeat protein
MHGGIANFRISITAITLAAFCASAVAAQAGPYEIGKAADTAGDYAVALEYWKPAAEQGDAAAQNGLAALYFFGHGVPEDRAESMKWLRRSADQGFTKAQGNLALFLLDGRAGKQDDAEALHYAGPAAERGNVYGQYVLGYLYYRGKGGVAVDYAKSFEALSNAAAQGYWPAQALLGELYAYGLGPAENHAKAYAWYKAALAQVPKTNSLKSFEVQTQIDRLIQRSTTAEINAGQTLAERCIASRYMDCGPR